jgi:ubiquinone/menaquinone biosynthesis C-methylase UbiE
MNTPTNTYKLFADYYDLYVGGFNADLEFYISLCENTDNILEIGCGTGRILKPLLESGFQLTGVDISNEMLEKASEKLSAYEKSGQLNIVHSNFSENAFDKKFEKVFITFYTFNYVVENPLDFLKNVYKSMNDGGKVVIDLFYPKTYIDKNTEGRWSEHTFSTVGQQIKIRDMRTVTNEIELRTQIFYIDGKETKIETERKYYSPTKIKSLLQLAGFKEIRFSLTYNVDRFSELIDENRLVTNFVVMAQK